MSYASAEHGPNKQNGLATGISARYDCIKFTLILSLVFRFSYNCVIINLSTFGILVFKWLVLVLHKILGMSQQVMDFC